MAGKRGHNARTQVRNSRGQFAPAPKVVVLSDSDDELALDAPQRGEGSRDTCEGRQSSKGKAPVTRARAGKGAVCSSNKEIKRKLPVKNISGRPKKKVKIAVPLVDKAEMLIEKVDSLNKTIAMLAMLKN